MTKLYKSYKFFKANAGYIVGECSKGALALARAEQWARDNDLDFVWTDDPEGDDCLGDHEYWCQQERNGDNHYHGVEICSLYQGDTAWPLAILGGIIDASTDYQRVIEAELALEAMIERQEVVFAIAVA